MVVPITSEILKICVSLWRLWGGWVGLLSCKTAELKMYDVPRLKKKNYLLLLSHYLFEFWEAEESKKS